MPRELPTNKKFEVIRLYFRGLPYDEIVRRTGVSKGAVVNIVTELREGRYPAVARSEEVDVLREVAVALRKLGLDTSRALAGLHFYQRLSELGVEPDDLDAWIKMCRALGPEEVPKQEFTEAALRLHRLKQELGRNYDEIANEVEQLTRTAATLRQDVASLKAERGKVEAAARAGQRKLGELQTGKEEMQDAVAALSKELTAMKETVAIGDKALKAVQGELEKRQDEVRRVDNELTSLLRAIRARRQDLKDLRAIGVEDEELRQIKVALESLATSTGAAGAELVSRLVEGVQELGEVLRLQADRARLSSEVDSQNRAVKEARENRQALLGEVSALSEQKAELEGYVKSLKTTTVQDVKEMTAAARDGVMETCHTAETRVEEIAHDILHLAEQVEEVGEEIEGLEGKVSTSQWLGLFQRFLTEPGFLSQEESREIVLLLLNGLRVWAEKHSFAMPSAHLLLAALPMVLEELEGRRQ